MVKATVDLQFLPQGEGFGYDPGATAAEQSASLKTILAACDDLKLIFNGLLPTTKRTWWNTLELKVVSGQVTTDSIVNELNSRLAGCKQTAADFGAIAHDLPATMSLATAAGGNFPSSGEQKFSVSFPEGGVRTYYGMPDGSIKCCTALTLAVNESPSLLAYSDIQDGFFKVVLAVHFTVPGGA